MPRLSDRQALIKDLDIRINAAILLEVLTDSSDEGSSESSESESASSDEEAELQNVRNAVLSTRYLSPRDPVPKSSDFLNLLLSQYDKKRFREEARMSRSVFDKVSLQIRDHNVFHSNSPFSQVCPEFQLLVAAYRLGHYGNGASVGSVARRFGISEGATISYTERVITALCSLQTVAIKWPIGPAKAAIQKRILDKSGFPDCIGCIDGTHVVLDQKPAMSAEDYRSRKKVYTLNALLVCDNLRRILYAFTGLTGSAHDSRVLSYSDLGRNPDEFFDSDEYVLAGSAYAATQHILPCYKAPASDLPGNSLFNKYHSSARIRIEHTNGILKGRMQSLKGLQIHIRTAKDHARALHWFLACCVLHNLLQEQSEYIKEEWLVRGPQDEENNDAGETVTGHDKREMVKKSVLIEKRNRNR